jgi:hypothetical protein
MISKDEFDKIIYETRQKFGQSWVSDNWKTDYFPLARIHRRGRCRYCTKKTEYVLTDLNYDHVVIQTVSNILEKSRNQYLCNLNCLFSFIKDKQGEIVEEITR